MNKETLEELDYVAGELSRSTNERHAEERKACLNNLAAAREVTLSDPREVKGVKVETVGDFSRVTISFKSGETLFCYGDNRQKVKA
jgi:hypothetical protein